MPNYDNSSLRVQLTIQINNLITVYESKAECGIFFRLEPDKSPLEILGVLDFLKDRIMRWGNNTLYTYSGSLFKKSTILVVGSRNFEEAISIIIFMFLKNVSENEGKINDLIKILDLSRDLEFFLRNEVSNNINVGFPLNPGLDYELHNHINKLINFKNENSSKNDKNTI